jgi:hypothetical protein
VELKTKKSGTPFLAVDLESGTAQKQRLCAFSDEYRLAKRRLYGSRLLAKLFCGLGGAGRHLDIAGLVIRRDRDDKPCKVEGIGAVRSEYVCR